MKPTKMSLYEIFDRQRVHTVPLYQRPYVWSLQKHWAPMWQDIKGKAVDVRKKQPIRPHFFGAVVFDQVPVFGRQLFNASIIDGQQRLTTSQVFLAAFRDVAKSAGSPSLCDDLCALTANRGAREAPHERFKVWPTNVDRPVFEAVMAAGSPDALGKAYPLRRIGRRKHFEPRPPLVEAYEFFHRAIRFFDTAPGVEEPLPVSEESLDAVFEVVKQHLQLVVIELERDDDPQVIFESLNGRSEALLPSDLIRNFVFLQAKNQSEPADRLYDEFWKEYDERPDLAADAKPGDRFWRRTQTAGRVSRRRLDLFIEHYLAYRTAGVVNIGHLYAEFRDWWARSPRVLCDELRSLRAHSDVYASLLLPTTDTRLGQFAARLHSLDTTTVYPLLLQLLGDPDGRVTGDDLTAVVVDLDSYLVRRLICGLSTAAYNRVFLQLLQKLRAPGAESPRAVVRAHLLAATGESDRWPDDDEFARAWLNAEAYKTVKPGRVCMVLTAIERQMRTSKHETDTPPSGLSVEHVMPQKWQTHWADPDPHVGSGEATEIARQRILHTFGNLTLVTQPLNSALSNGSFADKQREITKSLLCLNTYFQNRSHWDETTILERGKELLARARAVWPHPGKVAGGRQ
jgi:hypothetical protein